MKTTSSVSKAPGRYWASAQSIPRRPLWTVAIGLIALLYSIATFITDDGMMAPLSTRNVIRVGLITAFFLLLVFHEQSLERLWWFSTSALVPLAVILSIVYMRTDAVGADGLSLEGKLIEDLSFLFLMAAAFCMALIAFLIVRMGERTVAIIAAVGAIVFFLIAMEEISWFQRVLEIETPEALQQRNAQGEMNLHNLYTHESEDVYYLGGFLLLVVMPYFREPLSRVLDKMGIAAARVLLPSYWLLAPFVLAGVFGYQRVFSRAANNIVMFGSLIVLLGVMYHHYHRREWWRFGQGVFTFLVMIIAIPVIVSTDFTSQGARFWMVKEYREFFIAWGIAAYTVGVLFELFRSGNAPRQPQPRAI